MKRTILELGAVALALFVMLSALNYRSVPSYDSEETTLICVINPGYYYWDDIKNGLEQTEEIYRRIQLFATDGSV